MSTNGSWYEKRSRGQKNYSYRFKRYNAPVASCMSCKFHGICTKLDNGHGRYLERSEYDDHIEENKRRVLLNKHYYRQRQELVEHPFGTIKRSLGYTYTLLKTKAKVNGEFALIFTCYNLKRVINILGVKELVRRFKGLKCSFLATMNLEMLHVVREFFFSRKLGYIFSSNNKLMLQA